jgi:hypothetical protein
MATRGARHPLRWRVRRRVRLPLGGGGLQIAATVQEIDPPRRFIRAGAARGINAIHVGEFTLTDDGVLVHTEKSWDGEQLRAQTGILQPLLDAAVRAWLTNLKRAAGHAEPGRRRAPSQDTAAL